MSGHIFDAALRAFYVRLGRPLAAALILPIIRLDLDALAPIDTMTSFSEPVLPSVNSHYGNSSGRSRPGGIARPPPES
ncbi:hypothetical protein FBY10_11519 [Pseudomonas sp. SJZ103]|nr:hypothetical protein FBY10_11519 [Pseudomonas sp. SJZ103]TWC80311.1 hypothetical protein FBY08_116159 [Pseudomonas sp. SJZ094]